MKSFQQNKLACLPEFYIAELDVISCVNNQP